MRKQLSTVTKFDAGDWNQRLRGVLDLCVLATLGEHERHGYAIASRLEECGLAGVKGERCTRGSHGCAGGGARHGAPGARRPRARPQVPRADRGRATLLREQGVAWATFAPTTRQPIDPGGPDER
jgi:hypothetical protein